MDKEEEAVTICKEREEHQVIPVKVAPLAKDLPKPPIAWLGDPPDLPSAIEAQDKLILAGVDSDGKHFKIIGPKCSGQKT